MTEMLFREDAYRVEAPGRVRGITAEGGIILDQSLFYPQGGGQPGDAGQLEWQGQSTPIATTVKGQGDDIVLLPANPGTVPPVGTGVMQKLDWARRLGHMRVHTALHLLSVVAPFPVNGGSISPDKGRLDFDIGNASLDKETLNEKLRAIIAQDLPIVESWITDAQLRAQPGLVKTMSVAPPIGQGKIRLVAIGEGEDRIDLQPCGGTHVTSTGEIGAVHIGKMQNKGRQNRRVYLHLGNG